MSLKHNNRAALLLSLSLVLFSCSERPVYDEAPFDGKNIIIAAEKLVDNRPVFFSFKPEDRQIVFFVLKTDGGIQSYFDACPRCYTKKLGFRTDKDTVVCRACDVSYPINDLKDGIGSCYPIKLAGMAEGSIYIIEKDSVLEGKKYF